MSWLPGWVYENFWRNIEHRSLLCKEWHVWTERWDKCWYQLLWSVTRVWCLGTHPFIHSFIHNYFPSVYQGESLPYASCWIHGYDMVAALSHKIYSKKNQTPGSSDQKTMSLYLINKASYYYVHLSLAHSQVYLSPTPCTLGKSLVLRFASINWGSINHLVVQCFSPHLP